VSPKNEESRPEAFDEELGAEDDSVIGRALRWSLLVLGVAAAVGLVAWFIVSRPEEEKAEQAIVVAAPQAVTRQVTAPQVRFSDITAAAGIDFVHVNGAYGDKLLPESMGGGVAFLDYDADGDQDLFFVNSGYWPHASSRSGRADSRLYSNDGAGRFSDVSRQAGLDLDLYGQGVAAADYDADGYVDLFVTAVGANRLLHNRGDGTFTDVSATAGVGGGAEVWSTSAAFFDIDNDGDLDLFVTNYVRWSRQIDAQLDYQLTGVGRAYGRPQEYGGSHCYLYRNNGDGTFEDVSVASGIQVVNPSTGDPAGKALAVAPVDVDDDGWIDLMVANDTVQNFFFHNNGDGTFSEEAEIYGLAYGPSGSATGAMGMDSGYYRNDHNLGFMIGNFANEMTSVYVSQDDPSFFVDDAIGEGIGAPSRLALSFGLFLFDYDLDGRLDMLQANGHVESDINKVDPSQHYAQSAQLFWNAGPEHERGFVPINTADMGDLAKPIVGRGAAYADIDGDGDLDAVLTQTGGAPLLLRNDQETGHHWLRVVLEGGGANRNGIGAWVEVHTADQVQRRQVMPARSYLSQVEMPLTFGLGEATKVEKLSVRWPDGKEQIFKIDGVDRTMRLEAKK
jgi:enediyne biosynthesis protein E4